MKYGFSAYGHPNILANHETTLEFTKDKELTLNGNCIVGVNSDFDRGKLKQFIKGINGKNNKDIAIEIKIKNKNGELIERIAAILNPDFSDEKELVIRKSDVATKRTFAIRADKSAGDLNRDFADFLKNPKQKIEIVLCDIILTKKKPLKPHLTLSISEG